MEAQPSRRELSNMYDGELTEQERAYLGARESETKNKS